MSEQRPAVVVPLRRAHGDGAPLEERDDDALMALSATGHRRAFEVLVARHLPALAGFCAKFLGGSRIGEEMAQEVLVEAWASRHRYRPEGRFRVFLLSVARSRCLNRVRDERRRPDRAPPPGEAEAAAVPAAGGGQLDGLLERERERQVRAAMLDLPPGLREALLLRYDHALEYAEIARIVGRREATVRSRVFHALKRLRAALAATEAT